MLTFRWVREEELGFSPSLAGSSPDKKFPQAEFSPYQNDKFEWNPTVCLLHLSVEIHDILVYNIFIIQSGIVCIMHCKSTLLDIPYCVSVFLDGITLHVCAGIWYYVGAL